MVGRLAGKNAIVTGAAGYILLPLPPVLNKFNAKHINQTVESASKPQSSCSVRAPQF